MMLGSTYELYSWHFHYNCSLDNVTPLNYHWWYIGYIKTISVRINAANHQLQCLHRNLSW